MKIAEPAAIGTAIAAAVNMIVLLLLNHDLSNDVQSAIVAVVTLLAGVWVRSRVTPVA